MTRIVYDSALVIAIVLASTQPSHAYLDPGTGSIVLQAVMGAVACGLVLGRSYLARIKDRVQQSAAWLKSFGRRAPE